MKYTWSFVFVILSFIFGSNTALAKELQITPTPPPQTSHCGSIDSAETWSSSGNVHVIDCNVTVKASATLTIQPGAIVKFSYPHVLIVQGTLRILGTAAKPVYLTSIKDDSIGGDSNLDGTATIPRPGDWSRVEFQGSNANSLIDYAIIRYGGGCCVSNNSGIYLASASPTIQNTRFYSNQHYAILADLNSFPTLTNNTYINNDINGLALQGGHITNTANPTIWDVTSTAYFITDDLIVDPNVTLTIKPGVVVKFNDYKGLTIQGALQTQGTPGSQVVFTSSKDDTLKGDTNNDGATTPTPGDWAAIQFENSSGLPASLMDYALIRYGGCCAPYNGGINLVNASPTIQNTVLTLNKLSAIQTDIASSPVLKNNTYTDNVVNGLALKPGLTSGSGTLRVTSTAYFIVDDVIISGTDTLTIQPGVVIKFGKNKTLNVLGKLLVTGTTANPVYFTSGKDDALKGDTNNDGATSPAAGDWSRIEFGAGSGSVIDSAIIRYGSDALAHGAITVLSGGSPTIQNTTITKNRYSGIYVSNGAAPNLPCNTILGNNLYGISGSVSAANQYWGNLSGPYHPVTNPTGSGDRVSDGVLYKDVRQSPCNASPIQTKTFTSMAGSDGWTMETSQNSNIGGAFNATATILNLGDDAGQKQYASILSFNTGPTLPDKAVVAGFIIKVKKNSVVGSGDPVAIFKGFMLDLKSGFFGNAFLESSDFQAAANKSYGPFSPVPVNNWYTIAIDLNSTTAYINKLSSPSGLTQIRLRFKLDDNNDRLDNTLRLFSGNATVATNRPQLIVQYYTIP